MRMILFAALALAACDPVPVIPADNRVDAPANGVTEQLIPNLSEGTVRVCPPDTIYCGEQRGLDDPPERVRQPNEPPLPMDLDR